MANPNDTIPSFDIDRIHQMVLAENNSSLTIKRRRRRRRQNRKHTLKVGGGVAFGRFLIDNLWIGYVLAGRKKKVNNAKGRDRLGPSYCLIPLERTAPRILIALRRR
jgi:hypothetical protein